jgi:hypothetical protein
MSKYRIKTEEEFKSTGYWNDEYDTPYKWCESGSMNGYMGEDVLDKFIKNIESNSDFHHQGWIFEAHDCVLKEEEIK